MLAKALSLGQEADDPDVQLHTVPLERGGRVVGALCGWDEIGEPFEDPDERRKHDGGTRSTGRGTTVGSPTSRSPWSQGVSLEADDDWKGEKDHLIGKIERRKDRANRRE